MNSRYSIKKIKAREILDSRGNPTVEVDVYTSKETAAGRVPSGASKGRHEAFELRDENNKRYNGKGVLKAVKSVEDLIAKKLVGIDVRKLRHIDNTMIELDGTYNKSVLGANAILGVSLACANLSAKVQGKQLYEVLGEMTKRKKILPVPFLNVINGGRHAANNLSFQEFMIVPFGKNFAESLRMGCEVYHELKKITEKNYGKESANVGDEGGFAPKISLTEKALDLLVKAVEKTGYEKEVKIAVDAAASEFYRNGCYEIDGYKLSKMAMLDFYETLVADYPIISIEDPFEQEHWQAWKEINRLLGKKIQIVGDDLLCTNQRRIKMAVSKKACNALLLKLNQIGTLTEAMDAARFAMNNKWAVMMSHRSGETEDTFIADLAVSLGCGRIKSGAPCRGERTAKYNRLLRIEEELGKNAIYAGKILGFRKC